MPKRNQNDPLLLRDQRRVIAAMLVCPSVRKVAERTKVDRHRIRRWLRADPAFVAALSKASESVFEAAMAQARAATSEAVGTLRRLMRSKSDELAMQAALEVLSAGHDANVALKALDASRNAEGVPGPP